VLWGLGLGLILVVGAGEDGAGDGGEAGVEAATLDEDCGEWVGGDGPDGLLV